MTTRPRRRILIADDHALVAEGLRGILSVDYDVVGISPDGRALLADATRLRPDIICLDIGMPSLNGIEAALQLTRTLPAIKLVFVTQQIDVQYLRAAFRAGGVAFVAKQSASSELLTALRTVPLAKLYITPILLRESPDLARDLARDPSTVYFDALTGRQREVLQLIAEGKAMKEISSALGISVKTVEFHKNALMNELGLRTTADLTRYALAHRIIG